MRKTKPSKKTFEEICPLWDEKIKKDKGIDFSFDRSRNPTALDIMHPKYCIVGEAHHWNDNYRWCKTCVKIAISFDNLQDTDSFKRLEMIPKLKDRFVRHWNSKHEED